MFCQTFLNILDEAFLMAEPKRVLVFCAHSDDQAIGAGGYIAKLAKEGAEVRTWICSFGEQSHPHLEKVHVRRTRVLESKKADKILGGSGVIFIGLREGKFMKDYEDRKLHDRMVKNLLALQPDLILTHASDDPHPDHRAVHRIVMQLYKDAGLRCEAYSFNVWNPFNLKRRAPKLVVDVTATFKRKLDAIAAFKSQRTALLMLLWSVYTKAIFWGLRRRVRYAEVYYKVR